MDEPPVPQPTSIQPIEPLQLQENGKHRIHADAVQHSSTVAVQVQGPNLSPNSESSIGADEVPISEDQPPDFNSNSAPTQHVKKSSSSHNNKHTKSSVSIKYNCNVPKHKL